MSNLSPHYRPPKPLTMLAYSVLTAPPCPACGSSKTIVFDFVAKRWRSDAVEPDLIYECCNRYCAFAQDAMFDGLFTLDDISQQKG